MLSKLSLIAALASAAVAAPLDERSFYCTEYVDKYDNLATNPLLPLVSPIGTYDGLKYDGWVISDNANAILGLKAQSNPNTIAASLQTDELQLGSLSLVPFGSIEAAAPTKAFDLQSFYFGCVTDLHNDLIDGAEACSISVTGYYAAAPNQIVPVATFSFAPTAQPAPLNLATLPAYFTGLKNVTFGVAGAGTAIATTALVVDNLAHCNYK